MSSFERVPARQRCRMLYNTSLGTTSMLSRGLESSNLQSCSKTSDTVPDSREKGCHALHN